MADFTAKLKDFVATMKGADATNPFRKIQMTGVAAMLVYVPFNVSPIWRILHVRIVCKPGLLSYCRLTGRPMNRLLTKLLCSSGHPIGATGLAQCAELIWQVGDALN